MSLPGPGLLATVLILALAGPAGADPGEPVRIPLGDDQMEGLGIRTTTASSGTIQTWVELPGRITFDPATVAHVVPRVAGVVREVPHRIGDRLEAGDVLAVLESGELAEAKGAYLARSQQKALADLDLDRARVLSANTARMLELLQGTPSLDAIGALGPLDLGVNRGALLTAYAELVAARARAEREEALAKKSFTSQAETQEAQSNYQKASASFLATRDDLAFANRRYLEERQRSQAQAAIEVQVAARKLDALGLEPGRIQAITTESERELSHHVVASPQGGVLLEQRLVRGEVAGPGSPPFVVADLATVWALLTVYQDDVPLLRAGQHVRIQGRDGGLLARGGLDWVSPMIDEVSRTGTARLVLANPEGRILPGSLVTGLVCTGSRPVAVAVPREAVQASAGKPIVFVRIPGAFEVREVRPGPGDLDQVEILGGLEPGETIATEGSFVLESELGKAEAADDE